MGAREEQSGHSSSRQRAKPKKCKYRNEALEEYRGERLLWTLVGYFLKSSVLPCLVLKSWMEMEKKNLVNSCHMFRTLLLGGE